MQYTTGGAEQGGAPPPYEKPVGDLAGTRSRRINVQRRLVYQVLEKERVFKILRMWTHDG